VLSCSQQNGEQPSGQDSAGSIAQTLPVSTTPNPKTDSSQVLQRSPPGTGSKFFAADVARWRGASSPDGIDSLIAVAVSSEGQFEGDSEQYNFTGDGQSMVTLSKLPAAIPRLVECLGWDQRAAAKWMGSRLLVGVICQEALAGTAYAAELGAAWVARSAAMPRNYEQLWVGYRNPPITKLRSAQAEWRSLLSNPAH
jgi:hypothetical protein